MESQVLSEKPLTDIQARETKPPQIGPLVVDSWMDFERQPRGRDPSPLLALLCVGVNAPLQPGEEAPGRPQAAERVCGGRSLRGPWHFLSPPRRGQVCGSRVHEDPRRVAVLGLGESWGLIRARPRSPGGSGVFRPSPAVGGSLSPLAQGVTPSDSVSFSLKWEGCGFEGLGCFCILPNDIIRIF